MRIQTLGALALASAHLALVFGLVTAGLHYRSEIGTAIHGKTACERARESFTYYAKKYGVHRIDPVRKGCDQ